MSSLLLSGYLISLHIYQKHGRVSDFKYTNEDKTEAYVKYTHQTQSYLLEMLAQEGTKEDSEESFKVRAKEEAPRITEELHTKGSDNAAQ